VYSKCTENRALGMPLADPYICQKYLKAAGVCDKHIIQMANEISRKCLLIFIISCFLIKNFNINPFKI
jgi:hypothetical protein